MWVNGLTGFVRGGLGVELLCKLVGVSQVAAD